MKHKKGCVCIYCMGRRQSRKIKKNLDGSGKPLAEPSAPDFAETLISELERTADLLSIARFPVERHEAQKDYDKAKGDLLQALRVPKGEDRDAWDRYFTAALQGYCAYNGPAGHYQSSASAAGEQADAAMAERSRREAQP